MISMDRRRFLYLSGCTAFSATTGCHADQPQLDIPEAFIHEQMTAQHIPGLAVAVIRSGTLHWAQGFGWADVERQTPMTPDTLMNIGSLSKTFVTTAVMQCVDRGECALTDDINAYLNFSIRNPGHSNTAITLLQLLTHHSSIADGSSYGHAYACGDSLIPLQEWIVGYFKPGGLYNNPDENFHAWAPGEQYSYNNVAFGLLAYLVERISGQSFAAYCQKHIFGPLGMLNSSWFVADIDKSQHAIPYAYVADGRIHSPSWGGIDLGLLSGEQPPDGFEGSYPDCIYDHPNFGDGFLRTSISQLVNYQLAMLHDGEWNGGRILASSSIRQMLAERDGEHGITWHRRTLPDGPQVWGHGGGDPGISTAFDFDSDSGDGVIIFANTWGASLDELSVRLFRAA
jgi:CubicO group peptidase (beta-lactamase class C family)